MKRTLTIYLLLFSILSSSLLTSCGDGTVSQSNDTSAATETNAVETTTEAEYLLPEMNMDGWTLSIFNVSPERLSWANVVIAPEESDGDVLNDAIIDRNFALCEKYNCNLDVTDTDIYMSEILPQLVLSGDTEYDIYVKEEGIAIPSFAPYVLDWSVIPHLSLDEAWWNPNATSVYNLNGKQFALAGNTSLTAISRAVCMVFNKEIWADYGDSEVNLYDLVNNGEWTVDKFIEINKSVAHDLDGSGTMDVDDLYGLCMGRGFKGYIASFLTGSGMNFTEKDSDGISEFTLHKNEAGINLVTNLIDSLAVKGFYYNEATGVGGCEPANFFKNGHALFTQGVPHDIYKLRDMDDDIGILPMPKLTEAQDFYRSAAWGGAVWCLSKTFDINYADNMGILLEAMAYMTYNDVIPVYREIALKTKTTRDEESADMLDIIFDSIYFDFGTNILYDSILADGLLANWWNKKSSNGIVSSIEKFLPNIESFIDDVYKSIDEME